MAVGSPKIPSAQAEERSIRPPAGLRRDRSRHCCWPMTRPRPKASPSSTARGCSPSSLHRQAPGVAFARQGAPLALRCRPRHVAGVPTRRSSLCSPEPARRGDGHRARRPSCIASLLRRGRQCARSLWARALPLFTAELHERGVRLAFAALGRPRRRTTAISASSWAARRRVRLWTAASTSTRPRARPCGSARCAGWPSSMDQSPRRRKDGQASDSRSPGPVEILCAILTLGDSTATSGTVKVSVAPWRLESIDGHIEFEVAADQFDFQLRFTTTGPRRDLGFWRWSQCGCGPPWGARWDPGRPGGAAVSLCGQAQALPESGGSAASAVVQGPHDLVLVPAGGADTV